MAAVFLPLGQTFGRLGNVVNGDIVGYPSNLPWAVAYPHPNALAPDHVTAFQPASIYELLFSLALFGFLWFMRTRVKVPGLLFAMYAFLYAAGQFGIFYLRDNPITILDLKQAQVTSLAVMVATLPLAAYLLRRHEAVPAAEVETPAQPALSDTETPAAAIEAAAPAPPAATAAPHRNRPSRSRQPAEATGADGPEATPAGEPAKTRSRARTRRTAQS
jgi:phosphatidylglycerol:prolipoprotein diacylglycerol transferase